MCCHQCNANWFPLQSGLSELLEPTDALYRDVAWLMIRTVKLQGGQTRRCTGVPVSPRVVKQVLLWQRRTLDPSGVAEEESTGDGCSPGWFISRLDPFVILSFQEINSVGISDGLCKREHDSKSQWSANTLNGSRTTFNKRYENAQVENIKVESIGQSNILTFYIHQIHSA